MMSGKAPCASFLVEDERKVASFIARRAQGKYYAVDVVETGEKGD